MHADSSTRIHSITQFIGVFIANCTVTIIGCGSFLTPRAGDRDTLPSIIIDDDTGFLPDPGDYSLLAVQSDNNTGAWQFKVTSDSGRQNDELIFEWDFGDGVIRTGLDQTYSFSEPGSYVVTVTAYGRKNAVAFVLSLQVDVSEFNEPPIVEAGDDQTVDSYSLVFLYGGGSYDPDDDVVEFLWAQTAGDPVRLQSTTEPTASFIAPSITEDTELSFTLTVSDGELTSQDTVNVYVVAPLDSASGDVVADAGPNQDVVEATTVTLNGTGSMGSAGEPLEYQWFQNAGPTVGLSNVTGALTTFQAPEVNGSTTNLVFELVVTQGDLFASDEVTISVSPDGGNGELPPLDCEVDNDCDDGQFCNGIETCVENICASGVDPCPGQACDGQSNECAPAPSRLEAAFAEIPVVLDGVVNAGEWSDAYVYSMNANDRLPPGAVVDGNVTNAADTSATISVKHQNGDLLIAIEVLDDNVIPTASDVWAADSVELFLDVDNSDSQDIGLNRFQMLVNAGGQSAAMDVVPPGSWQSAAATATGGYAVEWRINMGSVGLSAGQTYGFDIAISDVEPTAGTIATRYWYFSRSGAETDESLWGDLYLEPGALEPPALSLSPTNLDFGSTSNSMTVEVWNSGGQTLTYTSADDAGWLTVSPANGSSEGERDALTVTVNRGGLSDGQYAGEITVTPNVGSAVSIAVLMTVAQAGGDGLSPVIVASRTSGMAPLAIFFEGTQSKDQNGKSIENAGLHGNDLLEYTWDFGTGSEDDSGGRYFSGFNGAHVYETPGMYVVRLTVRDAQGQASRTVTITAQTQQQFVDSINPGRTAKTYYVDALNGSNSNSGLSPSQAWKTYETAFNAITNDGNGPNILRRGDRLLFKRGQTFPFTAGIRIERNTNVTIGAYGAGDRPLLQYAGTAGGDAAAAIRSSTTGDDLAFVDIRVNGRSTNNGALAYGVNGNSRNLLLLRCEISDYKNSVFYTDGLFVVGSVLTNAEKQNMFYSGSRLVLIDNEIGPVSIEHNLYGSVIDRAVISHNHWHDATVDSLRIAANGTPGSGNIVVSDNLFERMSVALSLKVTEPGSPFRARNVLIERNRIRDVVWAMACSDTNGYGDITIRNNLIELQRPGSTVLLLRADHTGFAESIGVQGLKFHNNTVVTSSENPVVRVETGNHRNVEIYNNIIRATSASSGMRLVQVDLPAGLSAITIDNQLYDTPNQGSAMFQVGSNAYRLDQWQNTLGKDVSALTGDPRFDPGSDSGLVPFPNSPPIDAGRDIASATDDYRRSSRPRGVHVDIGAYEVE